MKEGLSNAIDVRKSLTSNAMIVVWSIAPNAIYKCTMEEDLLSMTESSFRNSKNHIKN